MKNLTIPLPGTAFPKLEAIIRSYYLKQTSQKTGSESQLSHASINKYDIARNSKFLVYIGILKKARKSELTPHGLALGEALQEDNKSGISKIWNTLVEESPFFQNILQEIKFSGGLDQKELQNIILDLAGKKRSYQLLTVTSKTVINILNASSSIVIRKAGLNAKIVLRPDTESFVNLKTVRGLEETKNNDYDLSKLIRLCEEINSAFQNQNYLSVIMLIRAILDHVPPIFGFRTFIEVANNYGGKSLKKSLQNLQSSSRNIADAYLHDPIRKKESLPNETQVDFRNDLDVLLGEVVRILR